MVVVCDVCLSSEDLLALRDEYLSASPNGKAFIEQRYGKHVIQRIVEESYSSEWLKDNCKNCPSCGTNIQVTILKIELQLAHTRAHIIHACMYTYILYKYNHTLTVGNRLRL